MLYLMKYNILVLHPNIQIYQIRADMSPPNNRLLMNILNLEHTFHWRILNRMFDLNQVDKILHSKEFVLKTLGYRHSARDSLINNH